MIVTKRASEWKKMLVPVLDSKVDEFKLLGYSRTTVDDIWNCLTQKVWKGDPDKRLHEVTQDIFHLSSNIYMSYLTIHAYKDDEGLMASIAALTESKES
ncbi:post-transcriptional regulator [Aquibacillus koreensis]|uniref:Post-transcriptional regulator n=1 Tax=Aquibacillus koreensis TaxID=279446 RepID=A0A9X3WG22_9BACI|nr:post-transcriptional regulator [Aquibacillus koreensis]MCT2537992.1 post-transcriptional regulator [Aquibacillus koreensis]MDC3419117.1 post-transcriptional regulator [Aquibacillus koreensis]